ncbi:MAG: hypothetical protein COA57_14490 [Flavobacteriales bacterium]|nr:MAG: hypothetical protein COA57_14490 [Flavobacteriales bacterium]
MKILIYTPKVSNRLQYVFRLIFKEILRVEVEFTKNLEEFKLAEGVKISYAQKPVDEGLYFGAHSLLFEKGIKEQNITCFDWDETKAFFKTPALLQERGQGEVPFDPFAASFYLVSRYEEYLPHRKDIHGRFPPEEGLAFQNSFLQKPVVNIWAQKIKEIIQKKHSSFQFPVSSFQFIPTIDVDSAFAYKEKGWVRTAGAYARSLIEMNLAEISERTKVLLGQQPDPFDTFDYLIDLQEKYRFKPIYFFLVADYGLNDKNVPHTSKKFRSLIKHVGDYADVGTHPSYGSNEKPTKLKTEISRLRNALHKDITKSRQHFLKLNMPQTYRQLLENDITEDYTMGYASELGFRASICTPFNFYDLDLEAETKLKVHPFCLMEATLKYYKNTPPAESMQHFKPVIDAVKTVNGTLYTVWHNEFLSEKNEFKGWKSVFEEIVEYVS